MQAWLDGKSCFSESKYFQLSAAVAITTFEIYGWKFTVFVFTESWSRDQVMCSHATSHPSHPGIFVRTPETKAYFSSPAKAKVSFSRKAEAQPVNRNRTDNAVHFVFTSRSYLFAARREYVIKDTFEKEFWTKEYILTTWKEQGSTSAIFDVVACKYEFPI